MSLEGGRQMRICGRGAISERIDNPSREEEFNFQRGVGFIFFE